MWINRQEQKPKIDGVYTVFGTVNKGTEHETDCRFTAYWNDRMEAFRDKDGEDLTYIDEGVRFWFDFDKVPFPQENGLIKKNSVNNIFPELESLNLKEMRKNKRLTLLQVEEMTGISRPYLCQLENNQRKNPSYNTVRKLYMLYNDHNTQPKQKNK